MNFLKKTVIGLAILFALLLSGLWILTLTLTPKSINTFLSNQITNITGQTTQIQGNISWQIFPWPSIKVTKIHIGEQQNFHYFAEIENLLLNVQISPLIHGHLVFKEVNIDGLKLYFYHQQATQPVKKAQYAASPSLKSKSSNNFTGDFAIKTFVLSHGEVTIEGDNLTTQIQDLRIGLDKFNLEGRFFPLQFKYKLLVDSSNHTIKSTINFKGKTRLTPQLLKSSHIFQTLYLNGQLQLQDTTIDHFKIDKISANTTLKSGLLDLNPLNFSIYRGESIGHLNYELATTKFSFTQTATGLDLNKLSMDILNKNLISGDLDFSMHASGDWRDAKWQQRLQANGNILVKNGALQFIDLSQLISDLSQKIDYVLSHQNIETILSVLTDLQLSHYENGTTPFKLFNVKYVLANQKLKDILLLQTERFQLNGGGEINIADYSIANTLNLKLTSQNKTLNQIQAMFKNGLPFILSGHLSKPLIYPDIKSISTTLSRYLLKKTVNKPINQLKNDLKKELKSFFH